MIPAGMFGFDIEFFVNENELYALYEGVNKHWTEFSPSIWSRMEKIFNDSDKRHLILKMGLKSNQENILKFFSCVYGGLDDNGDFHAHDESKIGPAEYWPCPERGNCLFEGKICHLPGGLSKREIEVVKVMALDLSMIQIADKLNIAYGTLIAHKTSIFTKLKVNKNTAVITWAAKHKII